MEITVFIISSKNIDFDHVRQTGNLLICARDRDVWIIIIVQRENFDRDPRFFKNLIYF